MQARLLRATIQELRNELEQYRVNEKHYKDDLAALQQAKEEMEAALNDKLADAEFQITQLKQQCEAALVEISEHQSTIQNLSHQLTSANEQPSRIGL